MRTIFQSRTMNANKLFVTLDHVTAGGAALAVEEAGSGTVTEFRVEPNLPYCEPKEVYRSARMWTYDACGWLRHYIHDGIGGIMGDGRPGEGM